MKKLLIALFAIVFVCGCVNKPRLTRQEFLELREQYDKTRTRYYSDVSTDDVLNAVDELFRLADVDYEIDHGKKSCIAHRNWLLYLVLAATSGKDYWYVSTHSENGKIKVVVRSRTDTQDTYATPVGGSSGAQVTTISSMNNPDVINELELRNRDAVYYLFFSRLDFLLGKSDVWLTCRDARWKARKIGHKGPIDTLCLCATDKSPENAKPNNFPASWSDESDDSY